MSTKPQSKPIASGAGVDFGALVFPGRNSLTVCEVAEALRVTDQHIHDLIEEGQLGAVNVGGGRRRHFRIPVPDLVKFLHRRASK